MALVAPFTREELTHALFGGQPSHNFFTTTIIMAIDVVWQDESGATLATCPVAWEDRMGGTAILERSHCLQYIDPYGDATFNQFQLPQLVRELEQATSQIQGDSFRAQASQVVEFVRGCVGLHTYITFIGA